mmetsp:Transcript_66886/g.105654  ORF Transcript_66886/g.105654 Transcript_66886/m.105654 type:complete len:129 (+) Transcript_66886:65-451(+)
MAIRCALVFMVLQLGSCLRPTAEANESNEGLLQSGSNGTVAGSCCCYRPVGSITYTNPFGAECPVKGAKPPKSDRGCFRPAKPSPCSTGPHKYDIYCEWYSFFDCSNPLTNSENIMWNKAWRKIYDNM